MTNSSFQAATSFNNLSPAKSKLASSILHLTSNDIFSTLNFTDEVVKNIGPRLAGTRKDHETAFLLFEEMKKFGDHCHLEKFDIHPDSFLSILPVLSTSYIISSIFLIIGGLFIYLAVIGYLFGAFFTLMQFVLYEKTFDPFFPKKKGYNVSAVIEPTKEVKQQIILSGHHDSAFIFNYIEHHPKLYTFRIFFGFLIFGITMIFALYWAIFKLFAGYDPSFVSIFRFGVIMGSLVVIQYYFFKNQKGSPGAGDNLISTVMSMKIGQKFALSKETSCSPLQHTRLIILSTDGEECGLRGAAAYVNKHKTELKSIPSFNVNMDSIYRLKELKIMTSDINGTVKLSKKMAEEIQEIFASLGYSASLFPLIFGAGGTDSAEFAKAGIETVNILAVPTEFKDNNVVYHTSHDTVDQIESEVVEAILRLLIEYILKQEEKVD